MGRVVDVDLAGRLVWWFILLCWFLVYLIPEFVCSAIFVFGFSCGFDWWLMFYCLT